MIRRLPVPLTAEEKSELGERLARALGHLSQVEEEHKRIRAEQKELEEGIEAGIQDLARILREGKREREVDVEEEFDDAALLVRVREVGGSVILIRPMTEAEKVQARLPFTAGTSQRQEATKP